MLQTCISTEVVKEQDRCGCVALQVLDSKVDDLLDLDDDALRKLLKPCDNSEVA